MRRLFAFLKVSAAAWLLLTAPAGFSQTPKTGKESLPPELKYTTPYVYSQIPGGDLKLYAFRPPDWQISDKRPAILFFFGGSWLHGSPAQFARHAEYFSSRGMIAICVDYRVKERQGTTPFECVADGKAAVRWVRSHANELGVDPGQIAAAGGSAGGHVALSAAVLPDLEGGDTKVSCMPNALVLFNPVVDTTLDGIRGQRLEEIVKNVLGSRAAELSPAHHLQPGLPPTIIFHGREDRTVPFESVSRFVTKATDNGDKCTLMGYEGQGHGFYIRGDPYYFASVIRETDRFLASLGWLTGDPSFPESPPPVIQKQAHQDR